MGTVEDLIGEAEVVNISSIFGGTDALTEDSVKPISKKTSDLIGEAEAKDIGKIFGKKDDEEKDKDKETTDDEEEKPAGPPIEKKKEKQEVASLNYIQGCIDEALDDVKEERRANLENDIWLKLLSNKVGDGTTSDVTKTGILKIASAVLGGRADSLPDEDVAPSPVDVASIGVGSRVVVNNESNDLLLGEVKGISGSSVLVEIDETNETMNFHVSELTSIELDDELVDAIMGDSSVDSIIDRMLK